VTTPAKVERFGGEDQSEEKNSGFVREDGENQVLGKNVKGKKKKGVRRGGLNI